MITLCTIGADISPRFAPPVNGLLNCKCSLCPCLSLYAFLRGLSYTLFPTQETKPGKPRVMCIIFDFENLEISLHT
jgi:hypothetical protein